MTGGLLFICNAIGSCFQFSVLIVVQALVWSYAKNLEQNFSISMKKSNIKFDCYSAVICATLAVLYKAGSVLLYEDSAGIGFSEAGVLGIQYALATYLVFVMPASLGVRTEKENKVHTSYVIMFILAIFVFGQPAILISFLLISKTCLFLYSSQATEQLPINSNKTGVIAHILSHKDSRRIFLFLM